MCSYEVCARTSSDAARIIDSGTTKVIAVLKELGGRGDREREAVEAVETARRYWDRYFQFVALQSPMARLAEEQRQYIASLSGRHSGGVDKSLGDWEVVER